MTDYVTPCSAAPDDWFIEKDGRQYPDDVVVPEEDLALEIVERNMLWSDQGQVDQLVAELEQSEIKAALIRRRKARDACHVDCYARIQCLSIALGDTAPTHGTWGGYYPEELKQIRTLRDDRAKKRQAEEE